MDRATLDRIDASARGLTALVVWIGRRRSRLFLPVPLVLIGLAEPTLQAVLIGGVLVVCGSLLRVWASGYLQKNTHLITAGPYAYVRHPLYGGMLLILAGWCTMAGWSPLTLLLSAYAGVLYGCAMGMEERRLSELFPEHRGYRTRVPLLVPLPMRLFGNQGAGTARAPTPRQRIGEGRFGWATVVANGEPRILFWNALVTLLILARMWV
jgi:protein-S-isoprenylcysteine O-methyltransferase Ste14